MSRPRKPGAELLKDLSERAVCLAVSILDAPEGPAREFGDALAAHLADTWGGQIIYMPQDAAGRNSERAAQVYAEYQRGATEPELAKAWGLSVQAVYAIVRRERKKNREKQAALPLK